MYGPALGVGEFGHFLCDFAGIVYAVFNLLGRCQQSANGLSQTPIKCGRSRFSAIAFPSQTGQLAHMLAVLCRCLCGSSGLTTHTRDLRALRLAQCLSPCLTAGLAAVAPDFEWVH
jgi:hypothetical protein